MSIQKVKFFVFLLLILSNALLGIDNSDNDRKIKKDLVSVQCWGKQYLPHFLERNPQINKFTIETDRYGDLSIIIKGIVSNIGGLDLLFSSINRRYSLYTECVNEMVFRMLASNSNLLIGLDEGCHRYVYNDLTFLKETKVTFVYIEENIIIKSLLGIENSDVRDLHIMNAEKIKDYSFLKQTGIRELTLVNATHLFNLKDITQMKSLKSLMIRHASITNLADLRDNNSIHYLYIDDCPVSDITPVKGIKNLEYIFIFNTHIKDLSPLMDLPCLRIVGIHKNNHLRIPEPLMKYIKYYGE